jgi:hypothetical protein
MCRDRLSFRGIALRVADSTVCEKLCDWSRRFHAGEMTVDDVQESFAALSNEDVSALPAPLGAAVAGARQELDAIRYGMCQAGQAGEISRIFNDLESLMTRLD